VMVAKQERAARDRRPIFALLGANAISQVGNSITVVAGAWFVLETTGSAAKVGLVSAALGVGAVLPAVLGGPLVDRLGFRRASVLADLASAATVAAIPLLYLAGTLAFWHLLVLVFLLSSFNAQGDTARYAQVPALARRAAMPMERANAADRAIGRVGQLIGPPVAGFLIALVGAANVLFVDAATFSISAALVAVGVSFVVTRPARIEPEGKRGYLSDLAHGVPSAASSESTSEADEDKRGYFSELLEGLRFVRANRLLLSMVLIATVGNFLDIPLISVVVPVYAKTFYGSSESLGIVLGAFGAGALAGTLLFGAVGRKWPRRLTFLTCYVTGPLVIYGTLTATPPLGVLIAAAAVAGLMFGPVNPLYTTVIQERTPPQMLGRTFGVLIALALAGIPLGAALAGSVVEAAGIVPTIVGMGAIYLAVTVGMFLNPALRQMDAGRGH
jgi:predicted MFS family arabinose efflux permease